MARRIPIWVVVLISATLTISSNSEESPQVTQSLVRFMENLSGGGNPPPPANQNWGWSPGSDPCTWRGVFCDLATRVVTGIVLNGFNFSGKFDARSLCSAPSLYVLDLGGNGIFGLLPPEIGECRSLTDLHLAGNQFTGRVPSSLYLLGNLGRVDISGNSFAGRIPTELTWIPGLVSFRAQGNRLTGPIPVFNVHNVLEFDVSNNDLVGEIPDAYGGLPESCFQGNPGLCGPPLAVACPSIADAGV